MISLKKKIAISILICLSILLGGFASLFLQTKVKADDNNFANLTVEKVKGYYDNNEFNYVDFEISSEYVEGTTYYTKNNSEYEQAEITEFAEGTTYYTKNTAYKALQSLIDTDNVFMLNNANIEMVDGHEVKEYLHVKFIPNENYTFEILNVQVKLQNLDRTYDIHSLDITSTSTKKEYDRYFDLNNTYELTSTSDTLSDENKFNEYDAQGLYTFSFSYWIRNTATGEADNYYASTQFYLLNEKYYVNPIDTAISPRSNVENTNDIINYTISDGSNGTKEITFNKVTNSNLNINNTFTEPRIFNTERIDRAYFGATNPLEQNYYNFTNQFTTDYFGENTSSDVLLYPILRFDATRYYVTWSKTFRGVTTTYEAVLNLANYPKLVVTEKNSVGTIIGTSEITDVSEYESTFESELYNNTYTQYIACIEFKEIGEYTFNFHYIFKGEVLQSSSDKLKIETDAWNIVGSNKLSIFGYKLNHSVYRSQNGVDNSEMQYVEYEEIDKDNEVFNRFNTYEYNEDFEIMYLTLDAEYDSNKTYFKRNYLMADVTNLNLDENSILGQEINASEGAIDLTVPETFNIEDIDTVLGLNVDNIIPTTNQAPVMFDYSAKLESNTANCFYYHFTKSGNTYTLSGAKNEVRNEIFTENGLYVVVVTYTNNPYQYVKKAGDIYEIISANNSARKVQVFVFEISNSEPVVEIKDKNNTDILKTSGYTNQDVTIDWSKATESPFDVKPYVRIFYAEDYINQVEITNNFDASNFENGKITVSNNGRYLIRVDFGPCTYAYDPNAGTYEYIYSASITYTFAIDKEAINGIEFYTIATSKIKLDDIATNNAFALVYGCDDTENPDSIASKNGKKVSGAKITVTYDFMPIDKSTDLNISEPFENGNYLYVANNTSITLKNENITYAQSAVSGLTKTNSSVLSNDGIYVFHFVDEAGNAETKYILKDTTNPLLLQKNDDEYTVIPTYSSNQDNIVNTDTEIVFGTHKAILLDGVAKNDATELENDGQFTIFTDGNNDTYLLVEVNNKYETNVGSDSNNISIYYNSNGTPYESADGNYTKNKIGNNNVSYTLKAVSDNEHLFIISVCDALGNKFVGKVEMNFDKSLLKAYVSGSPQQNNQIIGVDGEFQTIGDGTSIRLNNESVSNKKSLSISWIEGEDDFEVVSVVAYFYPLTFEVYDSNNQLNLNYPYSPSPYQTFDLMQSTTAETEDGVRRLRSAEINLVQDARYGEYATTQGMYHVVRIYANSTQEDGVREYYFFIDRNNLISYNENFTANNGYIGNQIKMVVGDTTNKYIFAGSDFLQEFVTKYILQTNKQPVSVSVMAQKYYFAKPDDMSIQDFNNLLQNSRIGINQLKFETVDGNGNILDENQLNFNSDFTTRIYDNSSDGFVDGNKNDYTQLAFVFSVNMYNPIAYFVDGETDLTMTVANQNSNISKNDTNVKLVWDNIAQNDLQAMIDESNIQIDMVLENGTRSTIYKIANGIVSINRANVTNIVEHNESNCYINLAKFANVITSNCRLEITLQYQSQAGQTYYGEYLSSTKIIYFDFEKPQTNYNNLIVNDKYLNTALSGNLASFEDYNSALSFDNYAFAISSDWKLSTPLPNAFWQYGIENATSNPNDVQTIWYRVYNKYADESGKNAQSIVPGDDRYDNTSAAPTRYMFRANMVVENQLVYTQITSSLENFDFAQFTGKYVEIIEMDCAENYRIYTVYVPNVDEARIDYNKQGDLGTISDILTITKENTEFEINNKSLEITSIKEIGTWYMIDVLNGSTNAKLADTIKVAPTNASGYVLEDDALDMLNALIYNDSTSGSYYIIKITSAIYGDVIIHYHTPGQEFEIDMDIRAGILIVTINQEKYGKVTYVTSLEVYEMIENNGQIEKVKLLADNNGNAIKSTYELDDETIVYTFSYNSQNVRNLLFEYVDNFGQKYSIVQLLGITQTPFEEMISFNGNYIENEEFDQKTFDGKKIDKSAEYFTNSNSVLMNYQPKIYGDIKIYRNGEEISFEAVDVISKNIKQINLFSNEDVYGNDYVYIITFTDTSERNYLFVIHHYLKTSELRFVDTNNNYHNFDATSDEYESSVSRLVYLQFEEYDTSISFPIKTTVTITRTYYNENNVRLIYDYGSVESPFEFKDYGVYVVTAKNSLGTTKIYTFEFIKSDATYYSVKATVAGRTILLSPSEVKYYYINQGIYIDHYVSIYDATIDVNQERNLKQPELLSAPDALTKIYRISSDESTFKYEKYIAITKITETSNIANGSMYLNDTQITGSNRYLRTNENSVVLTLNSIFENESNLLKVNVIYGSKDLGVINKYNDESTIKIEFTTAGIYYIYISDLAGNRQSFNGTAFYTLSLVNNFSYNLNGEQGIYNAVFNNPVEFTVNDIENFVRDGNGNRFTISATLNGEPYTPTNSKGSYMFNNYGTYFVTLRGYINEISDENLVETTTKFSILNPNEAKFMHEYIGLNGYEVTKIEKDGNDITDNIKEILNSATLNKFAIYGGHDAVGGNGTYKITVLAHIDDIVGDREFTYSVKINKDTDILILCSIPEGDSTTKNITLQMNLSQIYEKIGECKVRLNGNDYITINADTASSNTVSSYTLSSNQRYNVTLETNSGNTIMSFVVTKVEPLNSVAIIVIVVVSVVVAGLVVTFILLRKRMRVR